MDNEVSMTPPAPTPSRALATEAVHAGRDDLASLGVHAPPIDLSTTYPSYDSRDEAMRIDAFATTGSLPDGPPVYARLDNPTTGRFETALARLEGTDSAVAFASGMAALTAVLLARASQGLRHVVAVRPLYGCSDHLLGAGLLGTEVTWTDPAGIADAIRPDTGLVMVETPANPTLAEVDIRAVAHACGTVPLLVDNTFATPVLQRPVEHGARIVLHSATKYLGGHGDVMGGVVACDEEFAATLRQVRFATGGVLHPLAGYLLLRGLSTLPVRVRAASTSAAELVRRLTADPRIARVHYPRIGGAMISFEVYGDPHRVISGVRLITPAVSLGSVDSLI
ncbi:cystathionine gamma-synthase, partial [Streptomyces sp. Termitarium-T10T-6]